MVDSLTVAKVHTINELLEVSTSFIFTKSTMMDLRIKARHQCVSKPNKAVLIAYVILKFKPEFTGLQYLLFCQTTRRQ